MTKIEVEILKEAIARLTEDAPLYVHQAEEYIGEEPRRIADEATASQGDPNDECRGGWASTVHVIDHLLAKLEKETQSTCQGCSGEGEIDTGYAVMDCPACGGLAANPSGDRRRS